MTREEERAREEIYDAIRFLPPRVAQKLLEEAGNDMKKVVKDYENNLEHTIFNA